MPREYCRSKGWEIRDKGNQINIRVCPFCDDGKWHTYMNPDTGAWDCKKCGKSGGIYQLKKEMGDLDRCVHPAIKRQTFQRPDQDAVTKYHRDIFRNDDVLVYLKKRGISVDTVKHFHLGVQNTESGMWLAIPWFRGSECINIKYRSLPPADKAFTRERDCASILFNEDAIAKHDEIIITEGELDAITLWQHGFQNVVGATNGSGSFDSEWIDRLSRTKRIYICYDADEPGQRGAQGVAKRLGYNRCWNVVLPTKDANDFFLSYTADDFRKQLKMSRQFTLPGVITASDAADLLHMELENDDAARGVVTRWDNVNRVVCGWKPGDLVIVTALPKTGKTTFCLDVVRYQVENKIPCLFFCLEMRPERLFRKLVQATYKVDNPTIEHVLDAKSVFASAPLYFGHAYKFKGPEELIQNIRSAIQRYGLQFVVFDNLHILCRSEKINEVLSQTVLSFKLLAEEAEIPIVVIAQPRKRDNGSSEIMSAEDVKYSSSIHSDCDQMIILHRNRIVSKAKDIGKDGADTIEESMDPIMMVRVEAHRYGPGGETLLYYHGNQSRFDQVVRNGMKPAPKQRWGY